jgi:hypothetical protein
MASEAVGRPDLSATPRHDAASGTAAPLLAAPPAARLDAAMALGYEAADPALQAPLWAEAMQAAARPVR